jgi:hypothetical protein
MTICALRISGLAVLAFAAVTANAQFNESEGNDSKAAANIFSGLVNGSTITGNSTSASTTGLDYFRIGTAAAAPGIYQYRMLLNSTTAGHTGTIRGLGQVAAAAGTWPGPVGTPNTTDTTIQTGFVAAGATTRMNQWYGFGASEEIYYRVAGISTTTANYVATLERTTITPVDLGNFAPGLIDIRTWNQGHTTDTDLWIYDSNFNAIPGYGNDDESLNSGGGNPGTTFTSVLRRTYAPGTYYLALSNFQLANNMGSPCDDDFRTGSMLDFPNALANSSSSSNLNMAFAVNGTQFAATKVNRFDVNFYKFNVVPEPATMAVLGLGIIPFLRRRKK